MTKPTIIVPGPDIESDPDATVLWDQTGKFHRHRSGADGTRSRSSAGCNTSCAYGAENARKVLQAIHTMWSRAGNRSPHRAFLDLPRSFPGVCSAAGRRALKHHIAHAPAD